MRTKTLLVAAAVGAMGIASSLAQVYSVNAVGYVNLTLPNGLYTLIANPLNGTNNELNTVIPLPDSAIGSIIAEWVNDDQGFNADPAIWAGNPATGGAGWINSGGPVATLFPPGKAFFIQVGGGADVNVTFVGEVWQGATSVSLAGAAKYSFLGSAVPQTAPIGTAPGGTPKAGTLGLPGQLGDQVFSWNSGYVGPWICLGPDTGWLGPDGSTIDDGPTIAVGTGFAYQQSVDNNNLTWTRQFSVNP